MDNQILPEVVSGTVFAKINEFPRTEESVRSMMPDGKSYEEKLTEEFGPEGAGWIFSTAGYEDENTYAARKNPASSALGFAGVQPAGPRIGDILVLQSGSSQGVEAEE